MEANHLFYKTEKRGIMMGFFQYLSGEFKKITGSRVAIISLIVALLVPLVYAMIILSATWDPLDNLDNVPVAIVNNDKGADNDGEYVNVGEQLVETLSDDDQLGWDFVTEEEARKGIENQEYFMAVIVPEDFSEKTVTVMDDNPQKPELKFIQNEGMHYQGATVTNTAIESLQNQLATQITETYVATVFDQLGEVRDGFAEAHDGSEQIHDGTHQLKDGTNELLTNLVESAPDISRLADGAQEAYAGTNLLLSTLKANLPDIQRLADGGNQIKDGAVQLRDGAGQLYDGTRQAKAGIDELINRGLGQLTPGSQELYEGTLEAQEGVHETIASMQDLEESLSFLSTLDKNSPVFDGIFNETLQQLRDGLKEAPQKKKDFQRLVDGAKQLRDGLKKGEEFYSGMLELQDGIRQLRDGAKQLHDGTVQLDDGATELSDGTQTVLAGWNELIYNVGILDDGLGQIADGTLTVEDGWGQLTDGAEQLDDGALQLRDGSGELEEGLRGGKERTADLNPTKDNEDMFASPVVLDGETVNTFEYYRDANAPYIMTLALFVGVFALSFVIPFRQPAVMPANAFTWFSGKLVKLSVFAIVQALIISLFSLFVLKMKVVNGFALVWFSVVVSLTFLMILLFLVALAGNVGRFIALAFAVMQLSTTGSDLPIHMLPENLRDLSVYLPFTYSIDGYQNIITLGDMSKLASDVSVLFLYLALGLVLALIVFLIRYRFISAETEQVEEEADIAG